MLVPSGIILIWTGTHASIPTGWERVTSLDTKYPKGTAASTDPDATGGANTHTHTSPAHSHTLNAHTHTAFLNSDSATNSVDSSDSRSNGMKQSHTHTLTTSGDSGGTLSDAVTYSSVNHEPPYYEVIFIKPTGGFAPCSASVVAFYAGASAPTNWAACDGAGGTPDLRDKYIKGAGTGANAGTTGGGLTHQHDLGHTHTSVTHYHTGTSSTGSEVSMGGGGGAEAPPYNHTHAVTLDATSINGGAYAGTLTSGTVEPSYKKLILIKNTSAGASLPKGIIGMWLGTLATIPRGWRLCDGNGGRPDMRGYYAKGAASFGEIGGTGGANTHTHAASNSHTHTAAGTHTHTCAVSGNSGTDTYGSDAGDRWSSDTHTHTLSSISSNTAVWANATIEGQSSSNEPTYRTVAFVYYEYSDGGILFT